MKAGGENGELRWTFSINYGQARSRQCRKSIRRRGRSHAPSRVAVAKRWHCLPPTRRSKQVRAPVQRPQGISLATRRDRPRPFAGSGARAANHHHLFHRARLQGVHRGFAGHLAEFPRTRTLRAKKLPADADQSELTPEARAKRFLDTTLLYPNDTFDAVLLWDMLDYLDNDLMTKLAARITSLVRDGGVVFAMFHQRKPVIFHRYRVLDAQNLELIPALAPSIRSAFFRTGKFQIYSRRYRTSKMFVGRDQIREGLFVK